MAWVWHRLIIKELKLKSFEPESKDIYTWPDIIKNTNNFRAKKYISDFLRQPVILVVDNQSKHLWDIINFLRSQKAIAVRVNPLRFDLKKLKAENIDGVILTGGNDRSLEKKKHFNFSIIRLFKNKPILGICYGHEFLVEFYKGGLYKMKWRAQDLAYVNITRDSRLLKNRKRINVFKGHSFAAGILPDCFRQLGWSSDCEYEMVEHKQHPHFGVQFHPEKSSDGKLILANFLDMCRKGS